MTIQSQTRTAGPFVGTGALVPYPFNFKVFQSTDIFVVRTNQDGSETTLTMAAEYNVTLNSDQETAPGGIVQLVSGLPTGYTIFITSAIPEVQKVLLTNQGGFYPRVISDALDYLTILIQQLRGPVSRSLKFPLSDSGISATLPTAQERANTLLGFDSTGRPVVTVPGSESATGVGLALASFISNLFSSTGSSLIGFVHSGSGAVRRLLQDKTREMGHSPRDYGGVSNGVTVSTIPTRRAIAAAVASGGALDLTGGAGWVWDEPIDMTGVRRIIADFQCPIFIRRTGTIDADSFALIIGQPGGPGEGRTFGVGISGELSLICERDTPQCGVYLKGQWPNIDHIHAQGFNGTGIRIDTTWDGVIKRLRTEFCGNVSKFAIVANSSGDTTNCLHILSLQCEQSYHRGVDLDLLRCKVDNLHVERTYIMTTNDGTVALQSGLTYINHRFILGNTELSQSIWHAQDAGTALPDGSGTTPTHVLSATVYGEESTISTMQFGGSLCITGGGGLHLSKVTLENVFQKAPATKTIFTGLNCSGIASTESNCDYFAPRNIEFFIPAFNATTNRVYGGTIGRVDFSNSTVGNNSFDKTTIGIVVGTGEPTGGAPSLFRDCFIGRMEGAFNHVAYVVGGIVLDVALVSAAKVEFEKVVCNTFVSTGTNGYVTRYVTVLGSIPSWTTPAIAYPAGTRTMRPGFNVGGADFVNKDGGGTWVPYVSFVA